MPGTNAGTGQPISFLCHVERINRWRYDWQRVPGHSTIVRTGRTRDGGNGGIRMLTTAHEYRCECGHVGWSKHKYVLQRPLDLPYPY